MNVWIFVISALFTPVVEPLSQVMDRAQATPELALEADVTTEPRYPGIERLFAELDTHGH